MLSPKTRWKVGTPDPALVRELSRQLGVRPLLAALLASRGHTAEEAAFFLSEELIFHDPMKLIGMREAADRIREALRNKEKLLVYGDYDADGVSSTSLLIRLFRMLGADFTFRIPHRVHDGYGLHTHFLAQAKEEGVSLVVTVDTGITAVEQAEEAKRLGLDLIITDHHEPPAVLPDALAVVNPKRPDCPYPFKGLAGVGVAFKLAHALLGRVPEELAEWAALGTVADLMPLLGENRSIVKLGLDRLRQAPPPGFAALLRVAGTEPDKVTAHTVGFALAPRINAVGRLDCADDAVRLLVTDDEEEADKYALRLDLLNRERQRMVETAAEEAREMVEQAGGPGDAIVVASERWNPGIIGIVASRLVEAYYRPTVVIAIDPVSGMGKGSARAVQGFHLYQALKACESMFTHFGGHESAAGLSLHRDDVERFAAAFQQEAAVRLTPEMKVPTTYVDAALEVSDITLEAIEEIERLAPFGAANPAPKFAVSQAVVMSAAVIGKDRRHARFQLTDGTIQLEAVGFGIGASVRRIAVGSELSLVGELSVNEWNGRRTPQVVIKDAAVAQLQLFDWRDAAGGPAVKSRWKQAEEAGLHPALLLGPRDELPTTLAGVWAEMPAYRLSPAGECPAVPMNELALDTKLEQVTDLLLAGCPYPYERFHHFLLHTVSLCRIYALPAPGGSGAGTPIGRDVMKRVYVCMRELAEGAEEAWVQAIGRRAGLELEAARLAVRMLRELQLVEDGAAPGSIRLVAAPAKRDLMDSPLFAAEQKAGEAREQWRAASIEVLRECLLGPVDRRHLKVDHYITMEAMG